MAALWLSRLTNPLLVLVVVFSWIQKGSATNEAGEKWLQEKRDDTYIGQTSSGLLYKRMNKGEGQFHPSFDTYCKIDMEISRINDDGLPEVVETTTLGEPKTIRPLDSIPAVREAMERMVEGDWRELYVPSHLGYVGHIHGNAKIQGDEALLISLELVSIASGDTIPKGERHECYMELSWDQSTGQYGYIPTGTCDEKDLGYIHKVSGWKSRSNKAEEELIRLRSVLKKGDMKQSEWFRRRIHILKQFLLEEMRICSIFHVNTPDRGSVLFQEDCNAQEQGYISKVQEWDEQKVQEELERLENLDQGSVDALLGSWIRRRIRILNQVNSLRSAWASDKEAARNHEEL